MAQRSLGLARARNQARLLASIGGTALILVLALAAAFGWLTGAMRSAVVGAVDAVGATAGQTVLEVPATDDPDAQTERVEALLHERFGSSLRIEAQPAAAGGTSRWVLTVDPARFDPWATPSIAADLDDLAVIVQDVPDLAPDGASTEGGLAATLEGAVGVVRSAQAVVPVPLALIAAAGLVAGLQLARLLGGARTREAAVLAARGRSPRTALRAALAESVIVTALGSGAGWLAASGIVAVTGGRFVDGLVRTWLVPLAATVILGVTAGIAARHAEDPDAERSGRRRSAVSGIGAALLLLAAAVLLWLLAGLGRDAAAITADPWSLVIVALAPALGLAAVATLALLLFAPCAAAIARLTAGSRHLGSVLAARTTARQIAASGVVVAILALSAGGAVLAGAALATWHTSAAATGVLIAGADARGVLGSVPLGADAVAQADAAADVSVAAGVLTDRATGGGVELDAVLLPEQSAAELITPLPSAGIDPTQLAAALGSAPIGQPLETAATGIRATFDVTPSSPEQRSTVPPAGAYSGSAWFVDALGTPVGVPLEIAFAPLTWSEPVHPDPTVPDWVLPAEPTSGVLTAGAALPAGQAPWTLVGFSIGLEGSANGFSLALAQREFVAIGGGALDWPGSDPWVLDFSTPSMTETFAPVPDAVPGVVTTAFAAALGLGESDHFDLALDNSSRTIPVQIAQIVPAIPGSTDADAALLPLDQATLVLVADARTGVAPDELWASGAGAHSAIATAEPEALIISGADGGRLSAALTVPWWIAVGAVAALAGIALVAGALGRARVRAADVFVLAAQGVPATRQARWRTGENTFLAAGALAGGAVLGIPLALIAVPALTRAAVPGVPVALATAVEFDILPLAIVAVVIVAAALGASLAVGAVIRRQASSGRLPEAG